MQAGTGGRHVATPETQAAVPIGQDGLSAALTAAASQVAVPAEVQESVFPAAQVG